MVNGKVFHTHVKKLRDMIVFSDKFSFMLLFMVLNPFCSIYEHYSFLAEGIN